MSQNKVSFNVTKGERAVVTLIVKRATEIAKRYGQKVDGLSLAMDLCAVHANGCPLRFQDLLDADEFNFCHDVFGIERHIDRDTGALLNCFMPRFLAPASIAA